MTGILVSALFIYLMIRSIGWAIKASNRKIEAQRRQLKHVMESAEAGLSEPATAQPHKKNKPKKATVHAAQPAVIQGNRIQNMATGTDEVSAELETNENFDLRKAVIMAEILNPKYEE